MQPRPTGRPVPYIRADLASYDEIAAELGQDVAGERPSGGFEYESAEAKFDAAQLSPVGRAALDALRAAGATAFKVRYDGGYDEGFAHSEAVAFGQQAKDHDRAARDLATPHLVARIRAAAGEESQWHNASEFYASASDTEVIRHAMDELAHELASKLLGDGYGTGEYELYGAFTAHLKTGRLEDHEDAARPPELE
jgi:hypothetical protein